MRMNQTISIDISEDDTITNTKNLIKERKFSEFVSWCLGQKELVDKFQATRGQ